MRSLSKGTPKFWTRDMPHDDTWNPNRHHSDTLTLFRNHLTRNAVAMPPSPVNPVAQPEHERRDSHLSVVSHTEDAEEKGRRVVFGLPELSNVYSTSHHGDSSCAAEPQDAAVEVANPGRQRQNSGEGMSSPFGQTLGQWHGKGKHVPTVWRNCQRQRRDHWDQQGDPTATDARLEDASLQLDGGRELDLVQDEIDEAKRLLEEAHLEVQTAQSKVTEAACRVGEAMEETDGTRERRNCFLATARGLGFETSASEPCVLVLRSPQQGHHGIIGVAAVEGIAGTKPPPSLNSVSLSDTGKWERGNSAVEKSRKQPMDPCASGSQPTSRVWTLCLSGN